VENVREGLPGSCVTSILFDTNDRAQVAYTGPQVDNLRGLYLTRRWDSTLRLRMAYRTAPAGEPAAQPAGSADGSRWQLGLSASDGEHESNGAWLRAFATLPARGARVVPPGPEAPPGSFAIELAFEVADDAGGTTSASGLSVADAGPLTARLRLRGGPANGHVLLHAAAPGLPDGRHALVRDEHGAVLGELSPESPLQVATQPDGRHLQIEISDADATAPTLAPASDLRYVSPNPTHGTVRFLFRLAAGERVGVDVFDARGARVASLDGVAQAAGEFTLAWDRHDAQGGVVPPGLYFARFQTAHRSGTRRLAVLR